MPLDNSHDLPVPDLDPSKLVAMPSRTIRFACNGCGKCCNHGPMMSIDEGLDLADVFLMGAVLRFSPSPIDVHDTGHPKLQDPECPYPVYVEIHCETIDWTEHTGRCSAQCDDGKCGIYERRPAMCRVVPFDLHLAPEHVCKSPQFDEATAKKLGFGCDWSDAAPVAVDASWVVDPRFRTAYEKGRSLLRSSQHYIAAIPQENVFEFWSMIKRELSGRPVNIPLPFAKFVTAAVALGRIDEMRAQRILLDQIRLASIHEAAALKRRDKTERSTTQHVREHRNDCRDALRNLTEEVEEARFILATQDPSGGPELTSEDTDKLIELANAVATRVAPAEGPWRDWQDAVWGNFFDLLGWRYDYLGADTVGEGPAFRLSLDANRTVDAWTVEQNPVVNDHPASRSFISFHGDYRLRNGTNGILLLLTDLGLWVHGGSRSSMIGWWLPPAAGPLAAWRAVYARSTPGRTAVCLTLADLLVASKDLNPDEFRRNDERIATDLARQFEESKLLAESEGYQQMYARKMGDRLAEYLGR